MQPDTAPRIPLFLAARLRLFPWWLVTQAWRSPCRAMAILAVAAAVAGLAVVAASGSAGACHWKVARMPGERAHVECVREAA